MPLVLLAAIILSGVIVTLFTVVNSGIGSSGRDRDFASAIQVADAGVQEAYVAMDMLIQEGEVPTCTQPAWYSGPHDVTEGACEGELGDGRDYDWSYECIGSECTVLAVGRFNDSARGMQIQVTSASTNLAGIIGVTENKWSGGGGGGGTDDSPIVMGTFGCIQLPTSASARASLEGFYYYGDPDELEGFRSTCWGPGDISEYFLGVRQGPEILDTAAEACPPGSTFAPNVPAALGPGDEVCVRRAHFPSGFALTATAEEPAKVYVVPDAGTSADAVYAGGGGGGGGKGGGGGGVASEVNAGGDPGALQVYVSSGYVNMFVGADVSMMLSAPFSECFVHPTGTFKGQLFCDDIHIAGTYVFDADSEAELETVPTIEQLTEERVPAHRRSPVS